MELNVQHLCKSFEQVIAVKDLSFTAKCGVTCILAPSGIGKTTLLRILLGLETADSGDTNARDFRWSAVFQEDRLLEHLDAQSNLRFALSGDYDETAAAEMLDKLQLTTALDKKVSDWSGGMKRRLALARALLAASDAIALDEPFTGLDSENKDRAIALIREAAKDKIILLVTHDEADAAALDAQIIRL